MRIITGVADSISWPAWRAHRVKQAIAAHDAGRFQRLDAPAVKVLQIGQLHKLNAFLARSGKRLPSWEQHVARDTLEASTLCDGYAAPFADVGVAHKRWLERVAGPLRRPGKTVAGATFGHVAARWGIEPFLRDLPPQELAARDVHGRSPAHVAAAYGHYDLAAVLDIGIRDALERTVQDYCVAKGAPDQMRGSVALPGWPCDGHADSHAAHCDAAVDYLDDWPDLTAFAARGRPAVVQGVLVKCGAYAKWTPEYLRDLLGGVVLRATSWWPFAAQGRVCDHVPPCPGVYVFETIDYKLIADELPKLPTAALIREPQIAIGAPGTGAPFHNHFPSMSLLLHGTKLWRLLPPSSAEWSLNAFGHDRPDAVEFEQMAGDIVLVPDAWAHATRLQSTCVSVTFEFIPSGHVLRD